MSNKDYDILFNILLIGDLNVGKTTFMLYLEKQIYLPIIGVDFKIKKMKNKNSVIKFQIWNMPILQDNFKTTTINYFKKINGIIIIFDVTLRESFDNVQIILNNIIKKTNNIKILLIGNKIDLINERCVLFEEAIKVAEFFKIKYIELSLKNLKNINIIFASILKAESIKNDILINKKNNYFDLILKWFHLYY
jgi:Ras-related protein Rab-1A